MPRILKSDEPYAKALVFKQAWESHYVGETYIITGKDLRFAKELAAVSNDEIRRRLGVYFRNEWWGEHCRHSLAAFVSNINSFVPVKREIVTAPLIDCSICGERHRPHKDCSKEGKVVTMPKEVGDALTLLTTKMAVK